MLERIALTMFSNKFFKIGSLSTAALDEVHYIVSAMLFP
jgi:hypothetical protein